MSSFASQFAPYAPPPDDPSYRDTQASTSQIRSSRPWFPVHSSSTAAPASYQSGGIPTFGDAQAGGAAVAEQAESQNVWETRFGMRVDVLAAFAYILGPISALLLLVLETHNDYVRFHAYQSALLTTPLLLFRIFLAIIPIWQWIRTFITLVLILPSIYMAYRAYIDAERTGLARFELPIVGALADQWVRDE